MVAHIAGGDGPPGVIEARGAIAAIDAVLATTERALPTETKVESGTSHTILKPLLTSVRVETRIPKPGSRNREPSTVAMVGHLAGGDEPPGVIDARAAIAAIDAVTLHHFTRNTKPGNLKPRFRNPDPETVKRKL